MARMTSDPVRPAHPPQATDRDGATRRRILNIAALCIAMLVPAAGGPPASGAPSQVPVTAAVSATGVASALRSPAQPAAAESGQDIAARSGQGGNTSLTKKQRRKRLKKRMRRTRVYLQGDSLTVGAGPLVRSRLAQRFRSVFVDAQIGRRAEVGLSRTAWSGNARKARIWVMALGTNNAPAPDEIRGFVRRTLSMAGRKRHVIWTTLVRPGGYEAVNRMLRSYAKKHKRLHLVRWDKHVRSHPWYVRGDGVHCTHPGNYARAAITAKKVNRVARRMLRAA